MVFEWYPEDGLLADVTTSVFVSIGGRDWDSWRKRLHVMWRVLRGEEHSCYEVSLTEPDAVRLRNALNDYIVALHEASWLEELADAGERIGLAYRSVCVTHMRFSPCGESKTGCVISEEAGDVERVRAYQRG
jgi:hypothetical protein